MIRIVKNWMAALLLLVVTAGVGHTAEIGTVVDNQGAAVDVATAAAISESVLWSFFSAPEDGENPVAGLIFDLRGNLHGTTGGGGANDDGTVFRLSDPRG